MIDSLRFIGEQLDQARTIEAEFLGKHAAQELNERITQARINHILNTPPRRNDARNMLTCVNSIAVAVNDEVIDISLIDRTEGGFLCAFTWRWSNYIAVRRLVNGFERAYADLISLVEKLATRRLEYAQGIMRDEDLTRATTYWGGVIDWTRNPDTPPVSKEVISVEIEAKVAECGKDRMKQAYQIIKIMYENPGIDYDYFRSHINSIFDA